MNEAVGLVGKAVGLAGKAVGLAVMHSSFVIPWVFGYFDIHEPRMDTNTVAAVPRWLGVEPIRVDSCYSWFSIFFFLSLTAFR